MIASLGTGVEEERRAEVGVASLAGKSAVRIELLCALLGGAEHEFPQTHKNYSCCNILFPGGISDATFSFKRLWNIFFPVTFLHAHLC